MLRFGEIKFIDDLGWIWSIGEGRFNPRR